MRRRFFLGVEALGQRLPLDGSIGVAGGVPNGNPADVATIAYATTNPLVSALDGGSTQVDDGIPPPCDPMDPNWRMIRDPVLPLHDPMRV